MAFSKRQFTMVRAGGPPAQDGGRMHERRLRSKEAAGTILWVHGLGESALCFEPVMVDERLASWHHLAVDLEGYGKSPWAQEPLSLAKHAEALAQRIEAYASELGPVVVVGHSMGGVIGTYLCELLEAQGHGGRIRTFVNVEGNVSPPDCGYSSRAVKFSLNEWLDRGFDQVLDAIYRDEGESIEVSRAYGASIQMCDPRAYHLNSQELVEVSGQQSMARHLARLEAPTVYIHGAPRGTGERSLLLLEEAGIERIRIENAGHWPFLDQHEAFVEAMVRFLDRA